MKDHKTFHSKGKQREITIKLGLSKSLLLNNICRANNITPKDVLMIGITECMDRGMELTALRGEEHVL